MQQKFLHQVVQQKYPTSINDIKGRLTRKALLSADYKLSYSNRRLSAVIYPILTIRTQPYVQRKYSLHVSFGNELGIQSGDASNGHWKTSSKGIQEYLNNGHLYTFSNREETGGPFSLPSLEEKDS